jgi:hypothetical protein
MSRVFVVGLSDTIFKRNENCECMSILECSLKIKMFVKNGFVSETVVLFAYYAQNKFFRPVVWYTGLAIYL